MSEVTIGFVGDVLIHRDNPIEVFEEVRGIIKAPQIVFANLEGAYTDYPDPPLGTPAAVAPPAHNLDAFAKAGFSVMSMANNHILDGGPKAMLETRARLRSQGVVTCGAGANLREAREPAVVEVNDLRVAFLAYASMFPVGYDAREASPGIAPLRAYNLYREISPGAYRPGTMPFVTTVPDEGDQEKLIADIKGAKESSDIVVASFHWGDYLRPFHITDHEKRTARLCIDHGVDAVIGHHHHALRGMEWYRGKPILYGLGHFVFDLRLNLSEEAKRRFAELAPEDAAYAAGPRAGWPLLPLHEDTRMTIFAWIRAGRDGVSTMGFLPCRMTPDGLVHPLRLGTPESDGVVSYIERCNASQRLRSRLTADNSIELAGYPTLRVAEL